MTVLYERKGMVMEQPLNIKANPVLHYDWSVCGHCQGTGWLNRFVPGDKLGICGWISQSIPCPICLNMGKIRHG